jgi:hypothetical protein
MPLTLFTSDDARLRTRLSSGAVTSSYSVADDARWSNPIFLVETQLAQAEEPRCLMINFLANAFGAL